MATSVFLPPADLMQSSRLLVRITAAAAVFAGCFAQAAHAQGFGLSEIGSCAVARGFAVTGAICKDASVIFWNPAAATRLPLGKTLTVGAAAIKVTGGFRQDTTNIRYKSDAPVEFPPHLFGTYNWGRWSGGLGVYVPYGLTSQWKEDFPGRFSALKASLQTIYVQPNIAYALTPSWSVGIGPVYGHSSVELIQGVDLSEQVATQTPQVIRFGQLGIPSQTEFARAKLKGSGSAWGVNVGVHGQVTPEWVFGARYISELKFKYKDADATFQQIPTGIQLTANNPLSLPAGPLDNFLATQFIPGAPLANQKGSSEITHPWQAQAGVGYTGFPGTTLSADIARIGWSAFKTLPVSFEGGAPDRELLEDYHDIWALRLGAEHIVQSVGTWQGWALRGGLSFAQSPAPAETVTPLLPDMNRRNFSVGVGVPLRKGITLDASYLYVGTSGRRGRIHERNLPSETALELNTGAYDLRASVLSLGLSASF